MNIEEALKFATIKFNEMTIKSAALDARLLLAYSLEKSIEYLLLYPHIPLTNSQQKKFLNVVNERCALKPLSYILGYREFYGRKFDINDKVLIPRPDTEILIDAVLNNYSEANAKILELGCGSGCIIITLLLEIPNSLGLTCDINPYAISITKINSILYDLSTRLEVIKSNWFKNIKAQKFDIIVANPPYIAQHEETLMSQEILLHEPKSALFANDDGLEHYKIIAKNAIDFLQDGGRFFLEIGFNQEKQVKEIFASHGYIFKQNFKDLNNHNRVLYFQKPKM